MKARVKATGKGLEVHPANEQTRYIGSDGIIYWEEDLDLDVKEKSFPKDDAYWTRLEHQYAGMAMQGILGSAGIMERINIMPISGDKFSSVIAELSDNIAHALVEKYKEKEERK